MSSVPSLPRSPWLRRYPLAKHPRLWFGRLAFLALAVLAACAVILMAVLADWAAMMQHEWVAFSPWLAFGILPAGFAFSRWLSRKFFPGTQGSGVPQAVAMALWHPRNMEMGARSALGKLLLTPLAMLWGATAGREGPSIFLGAAIMHAGARYGWLRHATSPRQLVVAGGAIGVAAAFNTPLAGIMFAIEELSRRRSFNANASTLMAVVLAGLASAALLGDYLYFGRSGAALALFGDWKTIVLCGLVGGLAGGVFSRCAILCAEAHSCRLLAWRDRHPILFAGLCGVLVAALGLCSGGMVWGTGYEEARQAVAGIASTPLWYAPAKMLSLLLTFVSGIPAGIFAPSLSIGAGLSAPLSLVFGNIPPGALALLCMTAYLAGLTQAPVSSFVIVLEMSSNHQLMIPLIVAAALGHLFARVTGCEPVFYGLAQRLPGSPWTDR